MSTLFASFTNLGDAERAVGELLARGFAGRHVHLIAARSQALQANADMAREHADSEVVTETPGGVEDGPPSLLHGIESMLAFLVRGFGLVVGENVAGLTVAQALYHPDHPAIDAAYLHSQGVSIEAAQRYEATLRSEGVVLALDLDQSPLEQQALGELLGRLLGGDLTWGAEPIGSG